MDTITKKQAEASLLTPTRVGGAQAGRAGVGGAQAGRAGVGGAQAGRAGVEAARCPGGPAAEYAGICVGGPLAGRYLAGQQPFYRWYGSGPSDRVAGRGVTYVLFEGDLPGASLWVPLRDEDEEGGPRLPTLEDVVRELVAGYRPQAGSTR